MGEKINESNLTAKKVKSEANSSPYLSGFTSKFNAGRVKFIQNIKLLSNKQIISFSSMCI